MSTIFVGLKHLPESPDNLIIEPESLSLGVSDVRKAIEFLHLGKNKTVLIKSAELLTEEAQNALLKTLEEPPIGAELILETPSEDLLLETVRSRCQVVYGEQKDQIGNPELFNQLGSATIPEKLQLAKIHGLKRDQTLKLITELLVSSKVRLNPKTIRALFKAKKYLKANCNTRLVIENLFLNW